MNKLRNYLTHPIEWINFGVCDNFSWYAKHVLYILNIHAQDQIEIKLWVRPTVSVFTHCIVDEWQQRIVPTSQTESKLFWPMWDNWIIHECFWTERRKPRLPQYLTPKWLMSNGDWCRLLISQDDIKTYGEVW